MCSKALMLLALLFMAASGAFAQTVERAPAGQAAPAASAPAGSQTAPGGYPAPRPVRPVPSPAPGAAPNTPNSASPAAPNTSCENGPCDEQPTHIEIATPAPAPAAWSLQDRIKWITVMLMVVLGFVGIGIGISTLKKIEQQTHYAEAAAEAAAETAKAATTAATVAAETAKAALDQVQAAVRAERPWVLVTVEPSRKVENRFTIMATNRGKGPARIVSSVDKITTEVEESRLPEAPELADAKANAALASVILLPGESTGIGSFGRDEVKAFCVTDAKLKRVENWEEMILLYGNIVYQDLLAEGGEQQYETSWCYWYIHGRRNSGMVAAGSSAYHRHT